MKSAQADNPVLNRVLLGEYVGGAEVFSGLSEPTAEDERWAGLCALNLNRRATARDLLVQAVARGCAAAQIELAAYYRFEGQQALAVQALARVAPEYLSAFDRALFYREQAQVALWKGELPLASALLEEAWRSAGDAWPGAPLRGPIAQLEGTVCAQRGYDSRAVERFSAALQLGSPARRTYARVARALSRIHLGQLPEAEQDLVTAGQGTAAVPLIRPFLGFVWGTLRRAQGQLQAADRAFSDAALLAREAGETETEAYAQLGRAAIATSTGHPSARAFLHRARQITPDWKVQALLDLREAALDVQEGHAAALPRLTAVAESFDRQGLSREASWAWLHAAAAALAFQDQPAVVASLEQVLQLNYSLGQGQCFKTELYDLKALRAYLENLPDTARLKALLAGPDLLGRAPVEIKLVTLGEQAMIADGRRIRFEFARAIEVIVYLLKHPGCRMEQLQAALFPDRPHHTSRHYIHGVRREVERQLPGVRLPYDAGSRTYRLELDGPRFVWDVETLQHAFNARNHNAVMEALGEFRGPFLPRSDSEWAREERDDVQRWIIRVGLEMMDGWFEKGEYQKCEELAARLLEIEPLDLSLNEFLIQAIAQVRGTVAARARLHQVRAQFVRDVGECPPRLLQLEQAFVEAM